jgi:hypothetical protein
MLPQPKVAWCSNKLALERRRIHLMAAIPISRYRAVLAGFALFALLCNVPLFAQEGADPGAAPPAPPALNAEQVAELVAPIALYPDALLGQVLTASTYPLEVVMAARWSAENPNVKGPALEGAMQQQAWDPSVKALAAVPQVLTMMSDKLEWTKALGDAYLAQPDDVAAAVQQLRARADAAGNLKSSNEQQVRRVAARRGSSASPRCPNTTPSSRSTPTSSRALPRERPRSSSRKVSLSRGRSRTFRLVLLRLPVTGTRRASAASSRCARCLEQGGQGTVPCTSCCRRRGSNAAGGSDRTWSCRTSSI